MRERHSDLADALKPYVMRWFDEFRRSTSAAGGSSVMTAHELGGALHTGTLREAQAPWALLADGSRALSGNLGVSAGVTIDGVDLSVHAADINAHHAKSHVLATNTALGADHTISGAAAGHVLRASSATAAAFAQLQHADLGGVSANQHHNQSHVLATNAALGADHTISGAAAGHVLRASSATAAAFAQLQHSDLGGVSADQHHNQVHVLATNTALGADHTISGAATGHVLRASSATAAAFAQLQHADLGGVSANQHHNQVHSITGADHTITASAMQVVGATSTNTLGLLTPSNNPGSAAAILATNASGYLQLVRLGLGIAPSHPLHVSGIASVTGSILTDGDIQAAGFGRFMGWNVAGGGWTGKATEIGVADDLATIIGYDRTGSVYIPVSIRAAAGGSGLLLTTDGNFGLSTTDVEAWNSAYKAMQLGSHGALMFGSAVAWTGILNNAYYDGAWKYRAAGVASALVLDTSGATVRTAASGSENDALTWTSALTVLSSNGYVGINDTTPSYRLEVNGDIGLTGTLYANGGVVDFGTNYFEELTDFELRGSKALSLFQTIKAASWNITTTGTGTFVDVVTPSVRATTGAALTVGAGTDVILSPTSLRVKSAADVSLEASSYASQTTGWRVTDAGEADFRYLFVDEMHAKSFIADLEQALAGGQIIAKSVAVVATTFTLPSAGSTGTLRVKDLPSAPNMAVFQSGDFVGLRQFSRAAGSLTIGWAWGTVTSYADGTGGNEGTQTWTFTRHAGTPGAATGTIPAEAIALDFGVSGNGFYEVNAIDGAYGLNSPYAQVVTWASHPATQTVRSRFGNLRGIFSIADEFGIYAGSGTSVTSRYIRASSTAVELRNVPLALYDGANNTMLLSAGAGNNAPFLALGATLPTGPLVEDGLWMGKDGSDYEFRVGTVSGGALTKGVHWNGTSLNIVGNTIIGPGAGFTTTALAHWKFDAQTSNPYRVNLNTHLGQYPVTFANSYRGDTGRFGGGLQLRPGGTNYIDNPSFEVNTTDVWGDYSLGVSSRVADGVAGSYCCSFATGATTNPYFYCSAAPTMATGEVWVFSGYIKAGNPQSVGKTVTLNLREQPAAATTSATFTLTNEWQRARVSRTLTHAAPTSLNVWFVFNSTGGSGDVLLIDAVQLESSVLRGYIDGSFDGVSWAGTAHNSASTQAGNSYLIYSKSILPQDPTNGTVMLWVKQDFVSSSASYNTVFRYSGTSGNIILRSRPSDGLWQAYWGAGVTSTAGVADYTGQWQHVAVTRTGGTTRLYVDGVYRSSVGNTELEYHATNGVYLGYSSDSAVAVIDEVTILDRALSADEIAQIYQSGLPLNVPVSNHELSVSNGGLSAVRVNSLGVTAINETGDESFALANGALTWGTRYSGGSALASGDLVLGDPDQFHLMYDASAASLLIGKATEEHIAISSTSLQIKYNTTAYVTIDSGGATFTGSVTASSGSITGAFDVGAALRVHTGGSIYSGAASTWQSAGYQLQYNAGTPRLYVGDGGVTSGDKYLMWDGTNIEWRGVNTSLTAAGLFTAGNASITGAIDANSGTIGALTVDGALTVGTGGSLAAGATSYAAGTGIWLEYNAGTPRLRIGTTAGNRLTWDGTTLTIAGNGAGVTAISGSNITTGTIDASVVTVSNLNAGNITTGTLSADRIGATSITAAKLSVTTLSAIAADMGSITAGSIVIGTTNKIWLNDSADGALNIGGATKATAPFRVSATGVLNATGATVSGTINSTDGNIGGWTLGVTTLTGGDAVLSNTGYLRLGGASADRFWASAVHSTHRLWIGDDTASSAPFRVTKAGALTATGVNVTGSITAESGSITGVLTVGASGEIRQGSGTWGSTFTGLRIWSDGGVGRIAGYNSSTAQWWASTDGTLRAGAGNVRLDTTGVSLLLPAIAGAFSESELTTNAAAMRWLPSLSSTWTSASDLSALYAYRETTYDSNDVALVSRVGSSAYTTRTARVLLQPMLWTGSVFKQANLIASINNTDSQLTWDGTKFSLSGGYMEFAEQTAPSAGAANSARLFARDNGSGKTQLCVIFNTGAIQVLATQP